MPQSTRVGLIGAGYIAGWHAEALRATPGVRITAICDISESAARALADPLGARLFTTVDDLIDSQACDAVHILTPPDIHKDIATRCLTAGLHVLVEKPVAESGDETAEILSAADRSGARFHPGHNFLGLPSYERMRAAVRAGDYGRISAAEITWALPLAPLRSGPFNLWLLRRPQNLLLELGPHLVAFAQDLFGDIEILHAHAAHPVMLPGDDARPQGFRILARAGRVEITFSISMVETIDDRSVTLRGSSARVRLDFAQDVLVVERENAADLVANPLKKQMELSRQHRAAGWSQRPDAAEFVEYPQSLRIVFPRNERGDLWGHRAGQPAGSAVFRRNRAEGHAHTGRDDRETPARDAANRRPRRADPRAEADSHGHRRHRVHRPRSDPAAGG